MPVTFRPKTATSTISFRPVEVATPAPAPKKNLGQLAAEEYEGAGKKIVESVTRSADRFAKANETNDGGTVEGQVKRTGALLEGALGVAAGGVQGVFAPFTAATRGLFQTLGIDLKPVYEALPEPAKKTIQDVGKWAEENPDTARNLTDALVVTTSIIGSQGSRNILNTDVSKMPKAYQEAFKEIVTELPKVPAQVRHAINTNVPGIRQSAIDGLKETYDEILTGNKTKNKKLFKAEAATEAKNAAGTVGKSPSQVLAENGIIPKQGKNARLDTLGQAAEFRKGVEPLSKINRQALEEVARGTEPVPLSTLRDRAIALARTDKNIAAGTAKDLVDDITKEFDELVKEYGENVVITKIDDIKSARWGQVKFDSTRPFRSDANYLIGKAAQETIETTAAGAGFKEVAQLNRHIGDMLEAAKFLESLDQQVLKGGRLQRYVFQAIGSTFGETIPGKIAGAMGGDLIAKILIDNSVAGPVRRLILANLKTSNPQAYEAAVKWLSDQNAMQALRATQFALPPANPTATGINQGRAVPVATEGPREIVGTRETIAGGRYVPPSPAPKGTGTRPLVMDVGNTDMIEPHIPTKELPTIQMGTVPRATGLPTAQGAPAVFTQVAGGGDDVVSAAQRHITEAKEVLAELPKAEITKLGGEKALVENLKKNLVDGLKAEGMIEGSRAISALKTTGTVESFASAVEKALEKVGKEVLRYSEKGAETVKKGVNVLNDARRYTQ